MRVSGYYMKGLGWIMTGLLTLGICACKPQSVVQIEPAKLSTTPAGDSPKLVQAPESQEMVLPAIQESNASEVEIRTLVVKYKALSDEYWAAARKIDDFDHIGTANSTVGVSEHTCFILGTLLDKGQFVEGLRFNHVQNNESTDEDKAFDLRIMGTSLSNFVAVADRILTTGRDQRVIEWNIDCVRKFDIPKIAYIKQDGRSTFYELRDNGNVLQVLGDIEPGYSQNIIEAIDENPNIKSVGLGSGGGLVYEAMKAGAYIRKKNLSTQLLNNCYSACPLVLMGGVDRYNSTPYPLLGFHQVYSVNGVAAPLDSQVYSDISGYLKRMNVNPAYVINKMWSSAPNDMTEIEGDDEALCKANIFTSVQRGCSSNGLAPD